MKKIFLSAFLLVSVVQVLATLMDMPIVHYFSKPLITITLGIYYALSVDTKDRSRVVLLALCFSFLGDTFLLFPGEMYFMLGLGAFLVAHLFYIFAYKQHRGEDVRDALQGVQRTRLAFPIILAGAGLVVILYPTLGDLKFPVVTYTIVILAMVLNALFRFGRTSSTSFWLVFAGALLFMASDSMLAINKFLSPFSYAHTWIMFTYCAAQLFIIQGLIKHFNTK